MDAIGERPRLRGLLEHFAAVADPRESWRVAHPLPEVLLLVVCGTIASCDDYEDIVDWGEAHLSFLRRFLPYHHALPCADWLRTLMNRIDPDLFSACFMSWARALRPDAPALVALDGSRRFFETPAARRIADAPRGKTSRRSHDRGAGKRALHLVSAFATNERLVLGQEAVADGACEQAAIPALLHRLAATGALAGAVVTIDAIACNPAIAATIVETGADYVLAVKENQPSLHEEMAAFFDTAPPDRLDAFVEVDKDHGRLETRRCLVSRDVDWVSSTRRYPGEYRFAKLAALAMVEATRESAGERSLERRYYIASAPLSAARCAAAVRGHWRIENCLHWVLDVVFRDDLSRLRKGHGAENMAVVRHFAINLVRTVTDKRSLKTRRKRAAWDPQYLETLLGAPPR
jgi:predicted transposase YbfD/YdcC